MLHAGVMPETPAAELPGPREPGPPYRICLVCLGNICRSPMAETVLRAELDAAGLDGKAVVDSAGTGDWHIGDLMDPDARTALAGRGYDGSAHRARQFQPTWLGGYDLILAMDARNLADLRRMALGQDVDRIRLFGEVGGLSGAAARRSSARCSTCSARPRRSSPPRWPGCSCDLVHLRRPPDRQPDRPGRP
jgi:protein-tyrosine phosphatase